MCIGKLPFQNRNFPYPKTLANNSMRNILIALIFYGILLLPSCNENQGNSNSIDTGTDTNTPIENLKNWLAKTVGERESLESLDFSKQHLTKKQAEIATNLLFQDGQERIKSTYENQWNNRELLYNGYTMPFYYQTFGDEPSDGRSLFISLHGGGSTTAAANDQQYENQKHLYDITMNTLEGVYLAPRAPTNTWDLWHQNHIDDFLNIIIQLAVIKENVNPNKVYLLGYSAGGDGVYQLTPRMADRWAGASAMAGHPNETVPFGVKNTAFTVHVGELDSAYDRNLKAQEWKVALDDLENNASGTYIHDVQLHEGLGHWMELEDAVALPWMQNYKRDPIPQEVAWKQDDRHHSSFYWIGIPENFIVTGGEVVAEYNSNLNEINIISNYSNEIIIYINDEMLNLDNPIIIKYQGEVIYENTLIRSILNIERTLSEKGDSKLSFPSSVLITNNNSVQE